MNGLGSFIYQPVAKQIKKITLASQTNNTSSQGALNTSSGTRGSFCIKGLSGKNKSNSIVLSGSTGNATTTLDNSNNNRVIPHPMLRTKMVNNSNGNNSVIINAKQTEKQANLNSYKQLIS